MSCKCPNCGFDLSAPALLRVRYMREKWGNSPAPYLSGNISDLMDLQAAGYATRDAAGWWIPTESYPV